jgi:hypothetical protein
MFDLVSAPLCAHGQSCWDVGASLSLISNTAKNDRQLRKKWYLPTLFAFTILREFIDRFIHEEMILSFPRGTTTQFTNDAGSYHLYNDDRPGLVPMFYIMYLHMTDREGRTKLVLKAALSIWGV